MHALALAYPSDELTPLSPLVGHGALSLEGQAAFDRNSGLLGDAYHGLIRQGIDEGSITPIDDIEARALMLPGLVSWLVKEDVPRDLAQQRHIAREVANLVALGLGN